MRDHKIRAWDKKNNRMIYWNIFAEFCDNIYYNIWNSEMPRMESTGLKDKNGQEIWEGDVLSFYEIGRMISDVVRYIPERAMFAVGDRPFYRETDDGTACRYEPWFEIIGNIHENPELINE